MKVEEFAVSAIYYILGIIRKCYLHYENLKG